MTLQQAQAADLELGVADLGDGTFARKVNGGASGATIPLADAVAAGLAPAVVDGGDGTFFEKVKLV